MKQIEVKGKDAKDFLHRLCAGRVKSLTPGQGARNLLLNGVSRLIAQFDLLCLEEGNFLLFTPAPCADALKEGLEQLHFAENLEIRALSAEGSIVPGVGGGDVVFSWTGERPRWPSPVPGFDFCAWPAPTPEGWEFARIGALFPWPGQDWNANTPALEAGFLDWIDRDKGCYPGQEVVEKSLNLGHPARLLLSFEGTRKLALGPVDLVGGGQGEVTSVAEQAGNYRALARLPWAKREAAPEGWKGTKCQK